MFVGARSNRSANHHATPSPPVSEFGKRGIRRPAGAKPEERIVDLTIDAVDVGMQYDGDVGVHDLTFQVETGSLVALVGPSGAGKTTIVRLLTGLLHRNSGELTVLGSDPEAFDADTRLRIGYLPQDSVLYPTLSVRENLDFVAATYGLRGSERADACSSVLDFVELTDASDRRLADTSGGMKRRVGLAAALVHEPDVLFLDEPTAGLDPILRKSVWEHLIELRERGRTLIVTTQYVGEAAYCDRIALLADGRIIEFGAPEELRRSAFGGELVDVVFARPPSFEEAEQVGEAIGASNVEALRRRTVRYTVPDAGQAIPRVPQAAEDLQLEVSETERFLPDFDDVFVAIVDRHRSGAPA